jgi:Transglutaminase-like superfamily
MRRLLDEGYSHVMRGSQVSAAARPAADPRRLTPPEKGRLVLEVLRAYREVRPLVRSKPLPDVLARLRASGPHGGAQENLFEAARLAKVVGRVLRPLPLESRCLTQSLVLTRLLADRGIETKLVIGVRPGDEFGAHAWVELAGQPLLPPGGGEFERLVDL